MIVKKNIKTILRKEKKPVHIKKTPLRKPEPFDIRSFAFLVVALGLAIFAATKFFAKPEGDQSRKNAAAVQSGVGDMDAGNLDGAAKKL